MKFSRREVARAAGDQPLTVEEERRRNGAHTEHGTGGGRCARIETEKGDARVRRCRRLKGRGERATMRTMRARDADGGFPAGDSFSVYPGPDGPLPSLRLFVFFDSLQDISALRLLEEMTDRKTAEDAIGYPITFKDYPQTADFVLSVRERVNDLIEKNI